MHREGSETICTVGTRATSEAWGRVLVPNYPLPDLPSFPVLFYTTMVSSKTQQRARSRAEGSAVSKEEARPSPSFPLVPSLVAVVVTAVVYHNALRGNMVFDDTNAIVEVRLTQRKRERESGTREERREKESGKEYQTRTRTHTHHIHTSMHIYTHVHTQT